VALYKAEYSGFFVVRFRVCGAADSSGFDRGSFNTTAPESPLKKKHVAICYHRCHEALAAGFVQLAKEDTKTNLADAVTKSLPGPRRKELLGRILY
jgi:hypothetical protein